MPENTDLWPDGHAPDRAELLQYLTHTVGLDIDQARQVVNRYHPPDQGGFSEGSSDVEWTEERLRLWVNAQPEVGSAGSAIGRTGRDLTTHPAPGGHYEAGVAQAADDHFTSAVGAADAAVRDAAGKRDRFYRAGRSAGFDAGSAFDPNALAQSIAIGVFTDAAGNPKIDPDTGTPIEVTPQTLWQAIKGQTFDMGTLRLPRVGSPRGRAGREGDDARLARLERVQNERRQFMTPSMAMAMLGSMGDDGIIKIQQQLWEAGLFGEEPPSWGVADESTRKAYMALFAEASLTPDDPIDRVLARLTDEAVTRGTSGGGDGTKPEVPAFKPQVQSEETLSALIDNLSQNLVGKFADPDTKKRLIADLQSKDVASQQARYNQDVSEATGGPGGLDAFMGAIGNLESGGNYGAQNPGGAYGKYQIMPANWGPWAERAGLSRNAPRTPENQEIVARHIMSEYYQRFGNWRDVAIAWFAGPGAVSAPGAERRSDGNLTVRQYADRVMSTMGSADHGGTGVAVGQQFAPTEVFDPQAEAEAQLKRMDPGGYAGHQFANRATEYFSLLQGVV